MSPLKRREMSAAGALVIAPAGEWAPTYVGVTVPQDFLTGWRYRHSGRLDGLGEVEQFGRVHLLFHLGQAFVIVAVIGGLPVPQ
jgi:hypothetical protein